MTPTELLKATSLLMSADILVDEAIRIIAVDGYAANDDLMFAGELRPAHDRIATAVAVLTERCAAFSADDPRSGLPTKPVG